MNTHCPLSPQPIDQLEVFKVRRPLTKTARRLAEGHLTIGFLGGSITEDGEHNWPGPVARWFAQSFPGVGITSENAGMGATGSDSACLRVQNEIIDRGCHLTFVEYAVNDFNEPTERRARSREGLIRKLLAAGQEVVLVYTYSQVMYTDMMAGKVPATIAEFETLADHYGLSSVWVGLHALNEVRSGAMKWGEWLPDALHPAHRGSWSYSQALIQFLSGQLLASPSMAAHETPSELPPPLSPRHWQGLSLVPLASVDTTGPWVLRRVQNRFHTGQVLETHTPGARVRFDFTGRGLALIFEYGKRSAEFTYRIDEGDWVPVVRERFEWGGDCGMVNACVISDELASGLHTFEMEVIHGNRPDCTGTECRLATIGVIP